MAKRKAGPLAEVGGREWRKVVFACELDEFENCPVCGANYAECPCPGPTMDGWEYRIWQGELWARQEEE